MKTIAFVIPWYGEKIPGGAEMELRETAVHLQRSGFSVEVLATCVKEFSADWNVDYYPAGLGRAGELTVRRFPVRKRDTAAFDQVNQRLMRHMRITDEQEQTFLREMVNAPALYEYIDRHREDYALFIFMPYMFGTTYYGMQICPEKSVLLPCFHDEAYFYLPRLRQVYSRAAGVIYNAAPERVLAEQHYDFSHAQQIVMGIGMNTDIQADAATFRRRRKQEKPYLLYAGRKDRGKNVHTLLRYFAEYKHRHGGDLQLLLIGGGEIDIPAAVADDVRDLGFVSAQEKYDAMAGALCLCQPSLNESFSLVIMESWLCGRPVLVHEDCAVTHDFAVRAQGGLFFRDYFDFEGCVRFFSENPQQSAEMGENGGAFVRSQFDWKIIIQKYKAFFAQITGEEP